MIKISITKFKNNTNKYIKLCEKETIFVTKYGKICCMLQHPFNNLISLHGIFEGKDKEVDEEDYLLQGIIEH